MPNSNMWRKTGTGTGGVSKIGMKTTRIKNNCELHGYGKGKEMLVCVTGMLVSTRVLVRSVSRKS
jgi:hypothetical protein